MTETPAGVQIHHSAVRRRKIQGARGDSTITELILRPECMVSEVVDRLNRSKTNRLLHALRWLLRMEVRAPGEGEEGNINT